jgi:thiamine transport system permease protein
MTARGSSFVLAVPLLIFLVVMLAFPVAVLLTQGFSGAALLEVWRSPYMLERLGWTASQAFVSTLLTLALGVPAAVVFSRYAFFGRRALEVVLGLPFVVPVIVAGMGFLALFGARGAVVDLTGTPWLVLMANVFFNYGVVVRAVSSSLETMERDLERVARLEGASSWQVWRFVVLPFAMPAMLSSAALVFLFCFASFGVPLLLGGERYATLEVEIYQSVQRLALNTAGALALLQLGVTLIATVTYANAANAASVAVGFDTRRDEPKGWARGWLMMHAMFALTLTLAPLGAVLWRSVWTNELTLEHYAAVFEASRSVFSSDVPSALLNNLRFVALALLIAVPLGVTHAFAVWKTRSRWLDAVSLLPFMVSATLLGVAYIVAYPSLVSSLWLLIAAYAMSAYPFVTRAVLTGLRTLDTSALEAARVDGAGWLASLRFVVLPLLSSSLRVGTSLAFAVVIGEFSATLVLQRPEWATLTTLIYDRLGRPGQLGEASALASLLLIVTALGFWAFGFTAPRRSS